jgi:hypothetical protein
VYNRPRDEITNSNGCRFLIRLWLGSTLPQQSDNHDDDVKTPLATRSKLGGNIIRA